jgi:cytochrome c-type biogenesis protein
VLKSTPFRIGSGLLLVLMGLHMTGVLRISALYRDTRFQMKPNPRWGLASSFVIGIIFAAGWTPCIGPILGSILVVAAMQGTTGALLLAVYSLGLGVPFLVAGYALEWATGVVRRLNRHAHSVELISGGSMIVMGLLVMFNTMTLIAAWASSIGFVVG